MSAQGSLISFRLFKLLTQSIKKGMRKREKNLKNVAERRENNGNWIGRNKSASDNWMIDNRAGNGNLIGLKFFPENGFEWKKWILFLS